MMFNKLKNFKLLFAKQKINVIPFTLKKGNRLQPYAIIIKTVDNEGVYEIVWSKMAYFNEASFSWLWETNNKHVDEEKNRGIPSLEALIKNKVSVDYLLN